jgi:hypothetical protein
MPIFGATARGPAGWGTARWAGPARVQRAAPLKSPFKSSTQVNLRYSKGSVRWTRTGPAQRAVPHPALPYHLGVKLARQPGPMESSTALQRKLWPCTAEI